MVWTCSKAGELIDKLWNVNCSADDKNSHGRKELIDTLWNVNDIKQKYRFEVFQN